MLGLNCLSLLHIPEVLLASATGQTWPSFFLLLVALHLVERRGQGQRPLDPKRHVDISTLLESIPDPVLLFDSAGRVIDLNSRAEQLCDRSREQLRNITIAELNALLAARDESDHLVQPRSMGVNRALGGELVRDVRRVFRHPDSGRDVETLTSASPIREPDGDIAGAVLIVRDVTELSTLQHRLTDTQRHKEVGQMAAGLAHDFNNVLDTILQAATLLELQQDQPAEDQRVYTTMIRKAVWRGAEIIDRVREYLRTGTGQQSELDVAELLRDVLDLTRPLWEGTRDLKVVADLKEVGRVRANASDLRRAFTNLVINALEAMPQGGELTVRCEQTGGAVRVTVSDTGEGIAPEQQRQLFEPYFTTKSQGTGLGLSGAQRIISALRGQIRFRSEVGKGTSFYVEIPLARPNGGSEQGDHSKAA